MLLWNKPIWVANKNEEGKKKMVARISAGFSLGIKYTSNYML